MSDITSIILKIDQTISMSRLNELSVLLASDRQERLRRLAGVLRELPAGAYLLGTGPSTVGIIPLTVEQVVLGRSATPLEKASEVVVDYEVADTLYFTPHEVSRAHARIVRGPDGSFAVEDLGSTCGTFVNGDAIDPGGEGWPLSSGDVVSLGPSQVSTYVFFRAED